MSEHRFSIVQGKAVDDKRISDGVFRTLAALGKYTDKEGWCFPSQQTLAEDRGVARQTVNEHIAKLYALGYLQKYERFDKDGAQTSSMYRLVFDAPVIASEPTPPVVLEPTPPVSPEDDTNVPSNVPSNARVAPKKKGDYLDLLADMAKSSGSEQALRIAATYDKMDMLFRSFFARNKNNDVVVKFIIQRENQGETLERFVQWVNRDEFNASRIWEYAENPMKIKTRWQVAMSDTNPADYSGAIEGV